MSVFIQESTAENKQQSPRKRKKKYPTKYNPKYQEDYPWAMPSLKGETFAFCCYCKVDICIRSVGAKGLRDHMMTCRHSQKSQIINEKKQEQQNITQPYHNIRTTDMTYQMDSQLDRMPMDMMNSTVDTSYLFPDNAPRYTTDNGTTLTELQPLMPTHHVNTQPIVQHQQMNNTMYPVMNEGQNMQTMSYDAVPNQRPDCKQEAMMKAKDPLSDKNICQTNHLTYNNNKIEQNMKYTQNNQIVHPPPSSEDLTCDVCGITFNSWIELKNDLMNHIKEAQSQAKKGTKTKKKSKIGKKSEAVNPLQSSTVIATSSDEKELTNRRRGRPIGSKNKPVEISEPIERPARKSRNVDWSKAKYEEDFCATPEFIHQEDPHEVLEAKIQGFSHEELRTAKVFKKDTAILMCRVCQAILHDKQSLKEHMKFVHNNGKPYQCQICNKYFSNKSNLEVHNKHRHSANNNPFECIVCGKVLSTRSNLRIHLRIHAGIKPYKCPTCSKTFHRKANLEMHVVYHTGEKKFTCELCGRSFFAISALKRHKKLHTGERNHVCNLCGSSYITATDLRRHKLKHDDVKPYPCNLCSKQFTRSHDLKIHIRYHTKEHRYTCQLCQKKFVESGNYRRHLRRHTGERPYICSQCGQTFSQVHHYKTHMENHTKIEKILNENKQKDTKPKENQNHQIILTQTSMGGAPMQTMQTLQPIVNSNIPTTMNSPQNCHTVQSLPQNVVNQTQNSTGVLHQYNYIYNSSVIAPYPIFDICPHPSQQ